MTKRKKAPTKKLKVLLLEPNYKNKYPPIGLMKISTYHKMQGHHVTFFKGDLGKLLLDIKIKSCSKALGRHIKPQILNSIKDDIYHYLKTRRLETLGKIIAKVPSRKAKSIQNILRHAALNVPNHHFDRIYVTTLFTFYWGITIKTIEFAKKLAGSNERVLVGGVMASLLKDEIFKETGIKPHTGLLNSPGILDDNDIVVDELPLDYSILGEIDYQYPTQSAYFTYMTKGCTRKCTFCSVPKLEPTYTPKIEAIDLFEKVKNRFGDQRNLMLMDNNVLASPKFAEIVEEIKQMGFTKDALFIEPNQLDIAIKNLKSSINDASYTKRFLFLVHSIRKRLKGHTLEKYDKILKSFNLLHARVAEKKTLLNAYKQIGSYFENYRSKIPMKRYVDFNQGVDARYVNEENMALMAQIPIRPLRIAFDHVGIKSTYIKAVELAAKNGIGDLSNYILYNFQDKPEDFYERLRINVDLGKRLGVTIFSFPMKYVPLFGEEAKDRKYVGKHWNKKYLRAIQCILNTTKGIVAPGYNFFQMSFGKTFEEFMEILLMPEGYIINRTFFEKNGMKEKWLEDFQSLTDQEKILAKEIILSNDFKDVAKLSYNPKILRLMSHYIPSTKDRKQIDFEVRKLRNKFNTLIRRNLFVNLTLTYDFENRGIISAL